MNVLKSAKISLHIITIFSNSGYTTLDTGTCDVCEHCRLLQQEPGGTRKPTEDYFETLTDA